MLVGRLASFISIRPATQRERGQGGGHRKYLFTRLLSSPRFPRERASRALRTGSGFDKKMIERVIARDAPEFRERARASEKRACVGRSFTFMNHSWLISSIARAARACPMTSCDTTLFILRPRETRVSPPFLLALIGESHIARRANDYNRSTEPGIRETHCFFVRFLYPDILIFFSKLKVSLKMYVSHLKTLLKI